MAIEELSELIKAVTKSMRGEEKDAEKLRLRADIITEIADVQIVSEELAFMLGAETEVEEEIKKKLVRQLRRIQKEEKECRMNA